MFGNARPTAEAARRYIPDVPPRAGVYSVMVLLKSPLQESFCFTWA